MIGLPTEEVMTRGDNLAPNFGVKTGSHQETGQARKLFTEVASSRETLNVTNLDKVVKEENLGRIRQYALCPKRGTSDLG